MKLKVTAVVKPIKQQKKQDDREYILGMLDDCCGGESFTAATTLSPEDLQRKQNQLNQHHNKEINANQPQQVAEQLLKKYKGKSFESKEGLGVFKDSKMCKQLDEILKKNGVRIVPSGSGFKYTFPA